MNTGPYSGRTPPEVLLSNAISMHGGVTIPPEALRKMIAEHWNSLSLLAHAVHAGVGDGWPKFTPKTKDHQESSGYPISQRRGTGQSIADILERIRQEAPADRPKA